MIYYDDFPAIPDAEDTGDMTYDDLDECFGLTEDLADLMDDEVEDMIDAAYDGEDWNPEPPYVTA